MKTLTTLLVLCIIFMVNAAYDVDDSTDEGNPVYTPTDGIVVEDAPTTAQTISPEGPHYHPIYRYSCNEDLSITFKGVNGKVFYFKSNEMPSQPDNCTIIEIPEHRGNFKLTKECLKNNTENRIVYVSVFDANENENELSTSSTPKANKPQPVAISGGHIFKLTCLPIPKDGVIRYALSETGVKDFEQLHEVYNEVKDVDMRFKEGSGIDLPDVSEVYIGDMFYMYIKYMGSQPYGLHPVKCSAYKGTFRLTGTDKTIDLWDDNVTNSLCLTQTASSFKLMENFKRLNATVVYAKLYGFRLADQVTGDPNGDDVTISCKVKICIGCDNLDKCGVTTAARKKRNAEAPGSLQTVHRTISIKEKALSSNDADTRSVSRTMVTVALLALVIQMIL